MPRNIPWTPNPIEEYFLNPDRGYAARTFVTSPNLTRGFDNSFLLPPSNALDINDSGHVQHLKVTLAIRPKIEHARMSKVNGIIVHQTGGSNAKGSLSSYEKDGANGAHFLIDKDGTIYQTASVYKVCHHVGNLKSRCMMENKCSPTELKALKGKSVGKETGRIEAEKSWPNRFPGNSDAIGIEIVGKTMTATEEQRKQFKTDSVYEPLTDAQQASFNWLLKGLSATLNVPMTEVFSHPTVSWKNPSEGSSAKW